MDRHSFARLNELLSAQSVKVVQMAALWGEARLVHPPTPEHSVIAVPVTLHLAGRLSAVVYAEMPVVAGGELRRERPRPTPLERFKNLFFQERRRAELLSYGMPDLGLAWHGEEGDEDAVALARHFALALADKFPDAEGELVRQFHMDIARLVEHLATLPLLHAGARRSRQGS